MVSYFAYPFTKRLAAGLGLLAVLVAGVWPLSSTGTNSNCNILQPRRPSGGVVIAQPGHYCLVEDWFVKSRFKLDIEGGRYRDDDDLMLMLASDDIVLDLQQHSVGTNALLSAIETPIQGLGFHHGFQPEFRHLPLIPDPGYDATLRTPKTPVPMNLTIRNGTVQVKYREEISQDRVGIRISGLGGLDGDLSPVAVVGDFDMPEFSSTTAGKVLEKAKADFLRMHTNDLLELNKKRIPTPSAYPKRNVLIENMKVTTRGIGIVVEGANTTIRNSVIETESGTGIWIYGPSAVIENNIIIVHGTRNLREADAPIRLQQADGAIIRNNRIVIKDDAHKRGLSTFDTGAITLQNNTFYGITSNDTLAKAFLGKLQMNAQKNTYEPIWKTWFNWSQ